MVPCPAAGFPPAGPSDALVQTDAEQVDSSVHMGLEVLLDSDYKKLNRKEVQSINGA